MWALIERLSYMHIGVFHFSSVEFCLWKDKKKNADILNTTGMDQEGCCFVFCTTQWMQKHKTSHLDNKSWKAFQWDLGGWEAEACTPPGVLLRYILGVAFNVSSHLYDFCCRFDACRLNCAVACGGVCGVHVAGLMHVGSIVLWHVEGFAVSMLQV